MGLIKRAIITGKEDGLKILLFESVGFVLSRLGYIIVMFMAKILTRDENIWIFSDFPSGDGFSQNRRYLFEHIENNKNIQCRPIWLTESSETHTSLLKNGYEVYKANSLRAYYYAMRAKYVPIDNSPGVIPWWCTAGATVIQMGHGIPLKSDDHELTENNIDILLSWKSADYAVYSSKACEEHYCQYINEGYETGFINIGRKDGSPIYTGFPKTDAIITDNIGGTDSTDTDSVQFNINQSDITIGYFPTRREGQGLDLETIFNLSQTEEFLQRNGAKLLIKPHRQLDIGEGIIESDLIQLVNSDTDSYQFLTEIDILITDYSSIYFDFLLLDRPIVFYTPDYSTYEEIRGVHPNYDNVIAGPRVNNFEALLKQLESNVKGVDEYVKGRQEIRDQFFEYADGNASKRIFEKVTN